MLNVEGALIALKIFFADQIMANMRKPTPYAWAPTKSGRRLAHCIDQPVSLVPETDSSVTGSSSASSTPLRPGRGALTS